MGPKTKELCEWMDSKGIEYTLGKCPSCGENNLIIEKGGGKTFNRLSRVDNETYYCNDCNGSGINYCGKPKVS